MTYFHRQHCPLYFAWWELDIAENTSRFPGNTSGSYYVDEECIACQLCVDTAPSNFKMSDDGTHAYVYKQPEGYD